MRYLKGAIRELPSFWPFKDRLQAVQNAAARIICGGDRRDSPATFL